MDINFYLLLVLSIVILFSLIFSGFLLPRRKNVMNSGGGTSDEEFDVGNFNHQLELSETHQQELIELARKSIESFIKTGDHIEYEANDEVFTQTLGVFITLRKGGALRGCIGQMWADTPLYQTVKDVAISAATRDPRFPPVSELELSELSIKISILSPLVVVEEVSEIEVGKHGLMIVYAGHRGVLLPQVPIDRGWDRITFLENLCLKAGIPADCWKDNPELYSFTTMDFGEGYVGLINGKIELNI